MLNLEGGYLGFTFDGHHSSEFGLLVVSDGDRYHQSLSPNFSDTVLTVPGKNGGYYFGTQLQMKDFTIRCAFNEMTTHMLHKIQNWLYPNKVGWLVFDETPYKKYRVKISNVSEPTYLPFDEFYEVKGYKFQKEILKGEINFNFFSFDEYGYENEEYEMPQITLNNIIKQQDLDSGLIPYNYSHDGICLPHQHLDEISKDTNFNFYAYNAGNGIANADFYFIIAKEQISDNDPLTIFNYESGESYIINNPIEIINNYGIDISLVYYYKIKILGNKKEIWLDCLNENKQSIITDYINIGGCYNHYYPKVYHNKPTEIMIMSQEKTINGFEPLFYTYSYGDNDFGSSDSKLKEHYLFEDLKKYWSDYILLTHNRTIEINSIINPVFGFIHNKENSIENENENQLVYLIYPNKFYCDKTIYDFTIEYKHTYI